MKQHYIYLKNGPGPDTFGKEIPLIGPYVEHPLREKWFAQIRGKECTNYANQGSELYG